jgi:regulatory protein
LHVVRSIRLPCVAEDDSFVSITSAEDRGMKEREVDELRPEYDFTAADFRGAVRGKYAARYGEADSEKTVDEPARPMKITAIEPQRLHPERVNVHVDGAFRLGLSAELVLAEPLRVGDEVDEARLAELQAKDQTWKARDAALSLLSYRARTSVELKRRLKRKGFDDEVAAATVERLDRLGVVDDAAFAESFVRDRVRLKPRGPRRLVGELRAKGVDDDTARAAVAGVMEREEATELDLALAAAARWKPRAGEEPARARARLQAFLARRGFGGDAVRAVLREKLGEP